MEQFRKWFNLQIYRFTVSSQELQMVHDDRKKMNHIRQNFLEIERRMQIHEKSGGNCSEVGGSGVSLYLMGYSITVYRRAENKGDVDIGDYADNNIVEFCKYKTK